MADPQEFLSKIAQGFSGALGGGSPPDTCPHCGKNYNEPAAKTASPPPSPSPVINQDAAAAISKAFK